MPRRRSERRVLGPYIDGREIRYALVAEGRRRDHVFTSTTEANRWLKSLKARWNEIDDVTVGRSFELYKTARMAKGTTEASIDESIRRIRLMFTDDDVALADLDEDYCTESYEALTQRKTRNGKRIAVATHQNILIQARSWLRWCKRKKWIRDNPLADVESLGGTANRGKVQHTGNEAKRLNAFLRDRAMRLDHAAIGCLMLQTMALRNGDVCKRVVRDVDMDGTVLNIEQGKTEKSNRRRAVPSFLQTMLLAIILDRAEDEPLFPTHDGRHHTKTWLKAAMKRFCRDAGVRYVCPHSLKGTAATVAKIVGKTAEETMDYLSHEDVRTQTVYEDAEAVQAAMQDQLVKSLSNRCGIVADGDEPNLQKPEN